MEFVSQLISDPTSKNILTLLIFIIVMIVLYHVKYFVRCVRLLDMKHEASIHAIGKSLGNGFFDYYREKLNELTREYTFKTGKKL
jgi:hypothetical protein